MSANDNKVPDVTLENEQNIIHKSVVVLFAIALVCYLVGGMTPAIIFGLIGFLVEISAWIMWIVTAFKKEK